MNAAILNFWGVVEQCLVKFHHLGKDEAHCVVRGFQARLAGPRPEGVARSIIYHEEPFYLANALVDKKSDKEFLTECEDRYRAIIHEMQQETNVLLGLEEDAAALGVWPPVFAQGSILFPHPSGEWAEDPDESGEEETIER